MSVNSHYTDEKKEQFREKIDLFMKEKEKLHNCEILQLLKEIKRKVKEDIENNEKILKKEIVGDDYNFCIQCGSDDYDMYGCLCYTRN